MAGGMSADDLWSEVWDSAGACQERFAGSAAIERATVARFHSGTPHHAWERGTNENTNGLIRQYLPKRQSMASFARHDCNRIAGMLKRRPRKRLGFRTPEECYDR
jgi:IS30 family transposase